MSNVVWSASHRFRTSHPTPWTPPTEVEQALLEAKSRDDWPAYFETLARNRLYFEVLRDKAEGWVLNTYSVFGHDPRVPGGRIWAVYSEGMLPAPEPHRVFDWRSSGGSRRPGRPTFHR